MAVEYGKGRDYISSTKMNYFHYFLTQLTGYTIHPSIHIAARPCRIADLGTQTAPRFSGQDISVAHVATITSIWPTSVAEDPSLSVEIDAFDISETAFPPATWLPSNVRLHLHDVYTPFPERFLDQFDVVHLRLFLTLSAAKVGTILENVTKLLKPGGCVQWTEHDKTNITPIAASPGLSTNATQRFIDLQQMPFPNYDALWVNGIGDAMTEKGLELVALDRLKVRPSMLAQMNELHLLSMMDVPKGLSAAIDTFRDDHLDALVEEYRKGVSTLDGFICVVGRKPLT